MFTLVLLTGCPTLQIAPYDTSNAETLLPVAMVSLECVQDSEINLERMEDYIREIMVERPDVRLICFGETILGWYWIPGEAAAYQRSVAEPLDGPVIVLMKDLAAELGVYIVFGFTEASGETIYNSALIIDDSGDIIAHRRKSHFVPMDCFNGFTRGEKIVTTARIDGIKAAFLICNDFNSRAYIDEISGDPEVKMLILPHATANLEPDFWENYNYRYKGLWFLSAQRYCQENNRQYYGSWILDPNGYRRAYADSGPGWFYYEVAIR